MRKVHEKSIILGIGIGMIITAITGMIFSAGTQKELSKEEIISLAKGYGLIEKSKFQYDNTNLAANTTAEPTTANTTAANTTATNTTATNSEVANITTANSTVATNTTATSTPAKTTNSVNQRNIIIEVKDGFKSQHVAEALLEKGVIKSEKDFMAVLDSYKASTKINIGTFKFKTNDDLDYIVKTICNIK